MRGSFRTVATVDRLQPDIRPYRSPDDAAATFCLFQAAIRLTAAVVYRPDQIEAWARPVPMRDPPPPDLRRFLAPQLSVSDYARFWVQRYRGRHRRAVGALGRPKPSVGTGATSSQHSRDSPPHDVLRAWPRAPGGLGGRRATSPERPVSPGYVRNSTLCAQQQTLDNHGCTQNTPLRTRHSRPPWSRPPTVSEAVARQHRTTPAPNDPSTERPQHRTTPPPNNRTCFRQRHQPPGIARPGRPPPVASRAGGTVTAVRDADAPSDRV
jgi:hypothetical protein